MSLKTCIFATRGSESLLIDKINYDNGASLICRSYYACVTDNKIYKIISTVDCIVHISWPGVYCAGIYMYRCRAGVKFFKRVLKGLI